MEILHKELENIIKEKKLFTKNILLFYIGDQIQGLIISISENGQISFPFYIDAKEIWEKIFFQKHNLSISSMEILNNITMISNMETIIRDFANELATACSEKIPVILFPILDNINKKNLFEMCSIICSELRWKIEKPLYSNQTNFIINYRNFIIKNLEISLQNKYLLLVNYKTDFPKGKFLWVQLYKNVKYNKTYIEGRSQTIYLPPSEEKVILVLGDKTNQEKPQPEQIFLLKPKKKHVKKLVLRFLYENDIKIQVDETAELNSTINNINLSITLPTIRRKLFILWLFDGTLPKHSFDTFCKDLSKEIIYRLNNDYILFQDTIVYGEYPEIWEMGNYTQPAGLYTLSKSSFDLENNKLIPTPKPIGIYEEDDPASAYEFALKSLNAYVESAKLRLHKSSFLIIHVSNSIPHLSIEELKKENFSIVPTEELYNIDWRKELNNLSSSANIISIWAYDRKNRIKWGDGSFFSPNETLERVKGWWYKNYGQYGPTIFSTDESTPGYLSDDILEVISGLNLGEAFFNEPVQFPLLFPLSDLESK